MQSEASQVIINEPIRKSIYKKEKQVEENPDETKLLQRALQSFIGQKVTVKSSDFQ